MQKIFADAFFRIVADFIFSSILLSIICMDISWIQIFWYMLKYKLFNESLSQFGCNLDDTLEIFHFYVVTFCMTQKAWFFIGVALRFSPCGLRCSRSLRSNSREDLLACPAIARRATVDEVAPFGRLWRCFAYAPLACHGVICGADEDGWSFLTSSFAKATEDKPRVRMV